MQFWTQSSRARKNDIFYVELEIWIKTYGESTLKIHTNPIEEFSSRPHPNGVFPWGPLQCQNPRKGLRLLSLFVFGLQKVKP